MLSGWDSGPPAHLVPEQFLKKKKKKKSILHDETSGEFSVFNKEFFKKEKFENLRYWKKNTENYSV